MFDPEYGPGKIIILLRITLQNVVKTVFSQRLCRLELAQAVPVGAFVLVAGLLVFEEAVSLEDLLKFMGQQQIEMANMMVGIQRKDSCLIPSMGQVRSSASSCIIL